MEVEESINEFVVIIRSRSCLTVFVTDLDIGALEKLLPKIYSKCKWVCWKNPPLVLPILY